MQVQVLFPAPIEIIRTYFREELRSDDFFPVVKLPIPRCFTCGDRMVAKQQISVLNCLTGVRAKGGREAFYAKQKRKLSTKATDPCALGAGIPQDSHGNHHGQRDQKMASRKGYKVNLYDRCAGLLSDSPAASTVIVVGSESSRTPHILQDLKKAQWQIVVTNVDADHIDAHYSCATFSRRIITEQMLDHLLNKGCRRIAMVGLGSVLSTTWSTRTRWHNIF